MIMISCFWLPHLVVRSARIIETLRATTFQAKRSFPLPHRADGLGQTEVKLREICPDTVKWLPGRLLNRASKDALAAWVKELNLQHN